MELFSHVLVLCWSAVFFAALWRWQRTRDRGGRLQAIEARLIPLNRGLQRVVLPYLLELIDSGSFS